MFDTRGIPDDPYDWPPRLEAMDLPLDPLRPPDPYAEDPYHPDPYV